MNSHCAPSSCRDFRSLLGSQLLGAQAILPSWAQDRASPANRATVTSGLRFDNRSIFGSAVSPKAGLNLRITDYWRIRASYGRGFREPDLGQLYYRFLNPTNFYQVNSRSHSEREAAPRSKAHQAQCTMTK